MVRNYVRKTNRGNWSVEQIKNAVSAVLDKRMSCCLAAKTFGIPQSTLMGKVKRARGLDNFQVSKITSKSQEKEVQSTSISIIEQSDTYEEEDSIETEDVLKLSNTIKEEPIAINILENNNNQDKGDKDDICEIYGRLLAKKLKQVPEYERLEIMYEIDGLLLNRLREARNHE